MSVSIGTVFQKQAIKILLLGAGELGKELTIAFKRLGCEVIACDRYSNAPAMQVADRAHVFSMLDAEKLQQVIAIEQPTFIVPEVEAIATEQLVICEQQGFTVVPSAKAVQLTMDREGIRRFVAEELKLPTSPFAVVETKEAFLQACDEVALPCVIKPVMSSSGKGQSIVRKPHQLDDAWQYALEGGRASKARIMVEGFIAFDYEITLLTIQHKQGTSFCLPIGHRQENGDYQESWQPHPMGDEILTKAQDIAQTVTKNLGGYGIFGVELFIKGEEVFFNEVSPRPHDTGLVTLISQSLSEFDLHARAILGLPIPNIEQYGPSASKAVLVEAETEQLVLSNIDQALIEPQTDIRIFGKPEVKGKRRMAVTLARAENVQEAARKAIKAENAIKASL